MLSVFSQHSGDTLSKSKSVFLFPNEHSRFMNQRVRSLTRSRIAITSHMVMHFIECNGFAPYLQGVSKSMAIQPPKFKQAASR